MTARLCTEPRCAELRPCPNHPRLARLRGASLQVLRCRVFVRDGLRCQMCARVFALDALRMDHIVRLADGGTDALTNLQTLCSPCHAVKTREEAR